MMEVRSNRIGDIRSHYKRKLCEIYEEKEADNMLFMIIMEFTGLNKAGVLINHEQAVSESELLKIHFAVKDLLKEKPIQYVLGKTEFYGLPFIVNSRVLIPRPETEELVALVVEELNINPKRKVLDIGTGSGCIAITIKKKVLEAHVTAIDISSFALEVAAANADLNDVSVDFKQFDLLQPLRWNETNTVDIIVSNPPYVREMEKKEMKKNVLEYEPGIALFVEDNDPLVFYQHIIRFAHQYLNPGGKIFCEINQYLADECELLFRDEGFLDIEIHKDFFGNSRILYCTKKDS